MRKERAKDHVEKGTENDMETVVATGFEKLDKAAEDNGDPIWDEKVMNTIKERKTSEAGNDARRKRRVTMCRGVDKPWALVALSTERQN